MTAGQKITIELSEEDYRRIRPMLDGTEKGTPGRTGGRIRSDPAHRDRQTKRSLYYLGSDELYRENLYYIRGYHAYRTAIENADQEDRGFDTVLGNARGSDPTFHAALRRIELTEARERVRIIEEALGEVPEKYREGVMLHVVGKVSLQDPLFDGASAKTWKRWTQRFVYEVSKRRGLGAFMEALRAAE
ncbi:MAG: hypothetical protein IJH75_01530 [Mogibacterium sp.]|nr:hypothetical protein [Mogibacterium sp.]